MNTFDVQINKSLAFLRASGTILYPTDTIWGIGCDATKEEPIEKIYTLKKRDEAKSMIILVSDTAMIREYVSQPSEKVLEYLFAQSTPTTAIFENAINLPVSLINRDGTIAIRIAKDEFCQALIQKLTRPLVSTSANISGSAYPHNFAEINAEIKNGVDYIVQHRQDDVKEYAPSSIIKLDASGEIKHLR